MQPRRVMAAVLTTLLFGLVASANAAETLRSAAYEAQTANLKSWRPEVRIAAVSALTQLEEDAEVLAAVPLFLPLLTDEMPEVRIATARQLGRLGDLAAEAVPALGLALRDDAFHAYQDDSGGIRFESVALAAVGALADIGPPAHRALAELQAALTAPDSHLRAAAAEAIGYIGDGANGAALDLARALRDARAEVRFEAALALAHIGPLPGQATAALLLALDDGETFHKGSPSGAEVVGSVREAAAEALLTISEGNLSQIKQAGGAIRDPDRAEAELPWQSGQRLTLDVDEADVRDILTVILAANGMTTRFRRDVSGALTFEFKGMPVQGAFNMLLNEFNLTYDWNLTRRQVSFMPFGSVVFPAAGKRLVVTHEEPPKPRERPKRMAAIKPTTKSAPPVKIRMVINEAAPTIVEPPPAAKSEPAQKPRRAIKSAPVPRPALLPAQPSKRSAKTTPTKMGPAKSAILAEPTDISGQHRLSFIIKIDGVYRAMIDGVEYMTGGILPTGRGHMVITDIGKRSVSLLMKSADGATAYVIRKTRRRRQ